MMRRMTMVAAAAATVWVCGIAMESAGRLAEAADAVAVPIEDSASYFPDEVGNRWSYRGEVTEGPLQTIDRKLFVNESSVLRAETKDHVKVKVFHDSNGGNHGPSTSYYRRDAAGVVYYGSDPGTPLEKQLTPYQIVQFPLRIGSSFEQFNRTELDFGSDMDQDGVNEKVDVTGSVSVLGEEPVTVPAGTYDHAVRIEARMTMRILLSDSRKVAVGTDVMTAWFAKGVGLVKYFERQELPPFRSDRGISTEISEELVDVRLKHPKHQSSGVEPSARHDRRAS
ncbi:MAG: hypothetical protein U0172_03995 [Nitrospiraceae bacterium]